MDWYHSTDDQTNEYGAEKWSTNSGASTVLPHSFDWSTIYESMSNVSALPQSESHTSIQYSSPRRASVASNVPVSSASTIHTQNNDSSSQRPKRQIEQELASLFKVLQQSNKYRRYREKQPELTPEELISHQEREGNAMRSRGSKDSKEKVVWPAFLENALWRALVRWPPMGRKKYLIDGILRGRNELIQHSILKETGIQRTRKQVSSHLQVLKQHLKDQPRALTYMADRETDVKRRRGGDFLRANNTANSRSRPHPQQADSVHSCSVDMPQVPIDQQSVDLISNSASHATTHHNPSSHEAWPTKLSSEPTRQRTMKVSDAHTPVGFVPSISRGYAQQSAPSTLSIDMDAFTSVPSKVLHSIPLSPSSQTGYNVENYVNLSSDTQLSDPASDTFRNLKYGDYHPTVNQDMYRSIFFPGWPPSEEDHELLEVRETRCTPQDTNFKTSRQQSGLVAGQYNFLNYYHGEEPTRSARSSTVDHSLAPKWLSQTIVPDMQSMSRSFDSVIPQASEHWHSELGGKDPLEWGSYNKQIWSVPEWWLNNVYHENSGDEQFDDKVGIGGDNSVYSYRP